MQKTLWTTPLRRAAAGTVPGAGRSEAGRSGVDVLVSGPPLTGFEGPGPPNKETKTRGSAARFLRAQAPLWKKTKRVIMRKQRYCSDVHLTAPAPAAAPLTDS